MKKPFRLFSMYSSTSTKHSRVSQILELFDYMFLRLSRRLLQTLFRYHFQQRDNNFSVPKVSKRRVENNSYYLCRMLYHTLLVFRRLQLPLRHLLRNALCCQFR